MDWFCKGIHRCARYPVSIDLYANKMPPTLDTVLTVPSILDTAQDVTAFLFVFVLCSLLFLVFLAPYL